MYLAIVCRLLGNGAGGRGEITLGHIADNHVATMAGYPIIRLSESQRRYALLRAGAKFIPPLEAEGFLWLFCKAWIIKPTVSGVKRKVQFLLKIGILAKDTIKVHIC
jgi:hypothetical protein